MDHSEFVKSTVYSFQSDMFDQIKTVLIPEYLSFSIISEDGITPAIQQCGRCSIQGTGRRIKDAKMSQISDRFDWVGFYKEMSGKHLTYKNIA